MAHAEKCPVCNGTGIKRSVHGYQAPQTTGGTFNTTESCNGCMGKGWITVSDDYNYSTGKYITTPTNT